MPPETLTFVADVAQPRIDFDRIGVVVPDHKLEDGEPTQWDQLLGSNRFFDSHVAMAMPLPLTPGWLTNWSGVYTRMRRVDWTQAGGAPLDPDQYLEHVYANDGDYYLYFNGGATITPIRTAVTFPKNQPWYISFFAPGGQTATYRLGYFYLGDLQIAFYSNGQFVATRIVPGPSNDVVLGSGSIAHYHAKPKKPIIKGEANTNPAQDATEDKPAMMPGTPINVLLIPTRRGDLLVRSSLGGRTLLPLPDVDAEEEDPTITAEGPAQLSWGNDTLGTVMFQAYPLQFQHPAVIYSLPLNLPVPPLAGATATVETYSNLPGYPCGGSITARFVDVDVTTPTEFVGDDIKQVGRIEVTLDSDGTGSPFLYGATAEFDPEITDTADAEAEVQTNVFRFDLSVPADNPGGVSLTVEAQDLTSLEAGLPQAAITSDRPIEARYGGDAWFWGVWMDPDRAEHRVPRGRQLLLECFDLWQHLEDYALRYRRGFDLKQLPDEIRRLAMSPGFPAEWMDIEDIAYTLGGNPAPARGDFALVPRSGDSAATWLRRFWSDYAPSYLMGWRPPWTSDPADQHPWFRFRDPDGLDPTPLTTIYPGTAAAVAAGISATEARYHVYSAFAEKYERVAANELVVGGQSLRTRESFSIHLTDTASAAPDTAPSDRPTNWRGKPVLFVQADPGITTLERAQFVAAMHEIKTLATQRIARWKCQQMLIDGTNLPVWTGDCVAIQPYGVYRMLEMRGGNLRETEDLTNREFDYRGKYVGELPS